MGKLKDRKTLVAIMLLGAMISCTKLPSPSEEKKENEGGENTETPGNQEQKPESCGLTADIYATQTFGRKTKYFFYDLKGAPKALANATTASHCFKEIGMNGIRIPIYGDQANGGHTASGDVGQGTYDGILSSIRGTLNCIDRKDLIIFAGKKLDGKTSFPSWVMDTDGVNVSRYTNLLMDYLRFMKGEGVEIDVLGVDNELNFNEGNIDPQRFHDIVNCVKDSCALQGIKIPQFIGPELFVPAAAFGTSWLSKCYEAGLQDCLDIYGTHYYPQHHTATFRASLQHEFEIMNSDRPREFWATEPHWDNNDAAKADMLAHAEYAMCAMFDQTDLGMDMFCWWAFQYQGSLRAELMSHLSRAIFKAQPVKMTDHDGEDTMTRGKLQSRAYLSEKGKITAFLINMSSESYPLYKINVHDATISSTQAIQWRDDTGDSGVGVTVSKDQNGILVDLPSRSITEITFTL